MLAIINNENILLYYYSSYFILIYKVPHILAIRIARYSVLWQLQLSMAIRIRWRINFFQSSPFNLTIIIVRGRHQSANLGDLLCAIFRSFSMLNGRLWIHFHLCCVCSNEALLCLLPIISSWLYLRTRSQTRLRANNKANWKFFFFGWVNTFLVLCSMLRR